MTAEQLEELLQKLENGTLDEKMRADMQLEDIATSLARRVMAAEKLVEALENIEARTRKKYVEERDFCGIGCCARKAITAYREASK